MILFIKNHYIIFLSFFSIFIAPNVYSKPVKVFIFMGQSNMEGADTSAEDVNKIPPFKDALKSPKNIQYSYQLGANEKSNGWTTLDAIGNSYGPELTFAHELRKHIDSSIAIIKDAWGGTTLLNDWAPDGGDTKSKKLYARALKQIKESLSTLDKKNKKYKIEAIMWHQGENDMFDTEGRKNYRKNLANFIANLRKDLKSPKLKFFIGEISTKGVWGMDNRANVAKIRSAQTAVIKADPNAFFVPTSHFSFKVGSPEGLHYHFGTIGQLQHGVGYANAYLKQIGIKLKKNKIPSLKKMPRARIIKLFILGGQRNMEGEEAWIQELEGNKQWDSLLKPQKALYQYNLGNVYQSKKWKLVRPVNYLNSFGPELSFTRNMIPLMKKREVMAIYKYTDSGSQAIDWLPSGSQASEEKYRDRYQSWISGIKKCQQDLRKKGFKCEISAVFWHCGENDRSLSWMAEKYSTQFQKFMNATRKDLGLPKLKWILTEQPMLPKSISGDVDLYDLNTDLEKLAAQDPNLTFVKTADLPHRAVVFGTEGIIALGKRMADTWKKISIKK